MPSTGPSVVAMACMAAALVTGASPVAAQGSVVIIPGIRIGVVGGERLPATAARLEPFRKRMANDLGTGVEIVAVRDGVALVDAIATKRIDYAVMSASAYAMAWQVCGCVEPAAAPKSLDGTQAFRSVLLVRSSNPANGVRDLKGASVAAADARSVAGRLLPFARLAAEGSDPQGIFGRVETVNGPEAAVRLLLAGKVDAAFAWSTLEGDLTAGYSRGTLRDLVDKKVLNIADVRVVWSSPPLPHGPHAVRQDLAPATKSRIRETLLHLRQEDPDAYDAVEPFLGGGFATIGHAAYEPFLVLVKPQQTGASPAGAGPAKPPG